MSMAVDLCWPWCKPRRLAGWHWSPRGRRWWCRVSCWCWTAWQPPGGSAGRVRGGLSWCESRLMSWEHTQIKLVQLIPETLFNFKGYWTFSTWAYIQNNWCKCLDALMHWVYTLTYTPIGPMPGPPPPWGIQNVLCRLRWDTSEP